MVDVKRNTIRICKSPMIRKWRQLLRATN